MMWDSLLARAASHVSWKLGNATACGKRYCIDDYVLVKQLFTVHDAVYPESNFLYDPL